MNNMKCVYCGTNAKKIRKGTYECTDCGEFTDDDIQQESGKKSPNKVKFTGNPREGKQGGYK